VLEARSRRGRVAVFAMSVSAILLVSPRSSEYWYQLDTNTFSGLRHILADGGEDVTA